MPRRLSDLSPIVARSARHDSSHSISVEEIDNGYLVRKSSVTEAGEYKQSCVYSPEPPKVDLKVEGVPGGTSAGPLKQTVEYMSSNSRTRMR